MPVLVSTFPSFALDVNVGVRARLVGGSGLRARLEDRRLVFGPCEAQAVRQEAFVGHVGKEGVSDPRLGHLRAEGVLGADQFLARRLRIGRQGTALGHGKEGKEEEAFHRGFPGCS